MNETDMRAMLHASIRHEEAIRLYNLHLLVDTSGAPRGVPPTHYARIGELTFITLPLPAGALSKRHWRTATPPEPLQVPAWLSPIVRIAQTHGVRLVIFDPCEEATPGLQIHPRPSSTPPARGERPFAPPTNTSQT